jgi:hypothetical protein
MPISVKEIFKTILEDYYKLESLNEYHQTLKEVNIVKFSK